MCGIVGYTGNKPAAPLLLEGLSRLEYRGYDSAGLAVRDKDLPVKVVKAKGKLRNLEEKTGRGNALPGTCGIGHTRWATHGEPNETNAHPHVSGVLPSEGEAEANIDVAGVHNGIIENYEELKEKLQRHGYRFYSETDTEIVIKLVDYYYKKYGIGPIDAINRMMVRARGSYALALMFRDYPGEIYAARKDSPLIIGTTPEGTFLASDATAILKYTRNVYYIGNQQAARILPGEVRFFDLNGDEIRIEPSEITWDAGSAEKDGYEHFMLKEIHEQPEAVRNTLHSLIKNNMIDFSSAGLTGDLIRSISAVRIVACGTAYHAGMAAQYLMEELAGIPVRVEMASEFRYRRLIPGQNDLVIIISQSGETADSLEALRIAKKQGIMTLGVVNVRGSAIAREADHVLYTLAGPEIAVASTKAFTAQLAVMYALCLEFAYQRGAIRQDEYADYLGELNAIPEKISEILEEKEAIQRFASTRANMRDAFFIGRGPDYTVSMEGSLKLKEISYIHSEAYAAGELKHGTISLVEDNTLVIGVLTQQRLIEKTISNMAECKARGARLAGVTLRKYADHFRALDSVIAIPDTDEHFSGLLAVVPLQLLAYYISVAKGLDVDKPRNLAKSVTVE